MRRAVVVVVAACSGGSAIDAPPAIDAPVDAHVRPDAAVASCTPRSGSTVVTTRVANVADLPVLVTSPPNDPRLFVVERPGFIEIIDGGVKLPVPFLDLADEHGGPVFARGEQGLLGLAFHPDYATNRRFFVFYTTPAQNIVAEYAASATDPDVADPTSGRIVLAIDDFADNHNGGMIEFGPRDGWLYIGTGDGGNGNDPRENGQNPHALLAKILRIDVDGAAPYAIPPGNPFADGVAGAPEVLITGLRNPWRWSFDRDTSDLYIGDVGQAKVEEIDVVPYDQLAGADLGWDDCEGSVDHEATGCATPTGARRAPAFEALRPPIGTSTFEAIIGGAVYRSICFPDLRGRYFFSDHSAGGLWSFVWDGAQATSILEHPGTFPRGPTAIYTDAYGELYVVAENGDISHIEVQ